MEMHIILMTSWHGWKCLQTWKWEEFTTWFPSQRASNVELWFFIVIILSKLLKSVEKLWHTISCGWVHCNWVYPSQNQDMQYIHHIYSYIQKTGGRVFCRKLLVHSTALTSRSHWYVYMLNLFGAWMAQVIEIILHGRQGPIYNTHSRYPSWPVNASRASVTRILNYFSQNILTSVPEDLTH